MAATLSIPLMTAGVPIAAQGSSESLPMSTITQPDAPPPLQGPGDIGSSTVAGTNLLSRLTVPVSLDGSGPYPFLVDTGSEATVVSAQLASELRLATAGTGRVASSVSRANVDHVSISGLRVGSQTLSSKQAIVLDAEHLGAAGILGIDTLRDYRVVFDFAHDEIHLTRTRMRVGGMFAGDPGFDVNLKAKRVGDRMVLTTAKVDGIEVQVIIDTGSNFSVANKALRDRLRRAKALGSTQILDVTGAAAKREVIMTDRFRLGPLTMMGSPVIINDSPAFEELGLADRPALLLGMNHLRAFRRVSIDFARMEVGFELRS